MADSALKETKDNPNILIIDANPSILAEIEKGLKGLGFDLCRTAAPDSPIDQLHDLAPDIAILGPGLDANTSLKCLHKLKIIDPVMLILTSCDDYMSGGFSTCPFEGVHFFGTDLDLEEISKAIENALKQRRECKLQPDFQLLIGQSQELENIRSKIHKVCDKDITVLITGETGTGKELIARSIHHFSLRSKGPLVKVNCSALPDELLESEVFGFQKGAFTGADRDKAGRIEMANGGTLFIDEIGDISLSLQVKFLQVLEDKAFARLGGTQDRIVDTRVVAATNWDLAKKVREGTFRKDLFYRLNVVSVHMPPLRERKEDVPLFINYFLNKFNVLNKRKIVSISPEAMNSLLNYNWPGNVRQLENSIERAFVLGLGDRIEFVDLPVEIRESGENTTRRGTTLNLKENEIVLIQEAMSKTSGSKADAAELLGINITTLYRKIKKYDIPFPGYGEDVPSSFSDH